MCDFTPGPWKVVDHFNEEYGDLEYCPLSIMISDPNFQIATIVGDCVGGYQANARLIAESPTMHDLLLKLQAVRSPRELHNLRCEVSEVLARIEGAN